MARLIIILWALLFGTLLFAQYQNSNITFGINCGLYLDEDTLHEFRSIMESHEASASISDSLGNLLFYTNGEEVFNRTHVVMDNGDSLEIGGLGDFGSSLTQGVVIIPKPLSNEMYYIFQLQYEPGLEKYGLEYSIVSMNLDGGLGGILEKNIPLFNKQLTEKMQVVRHGNGTDWWLIVYAYPDYNETEDSTMIFKKYLITEFGIDGPFDQAYGPKESDTLSRYTQGVGQMIFNPNGNLMANIRYNIIDIFSFDRCSGLFTNWQELTDHENKLLYGCSFSQNSQFLFVSQQGGYAKIYAYSLFDIEKIQVSQKIIWNDTPSNFSIGAQMLIANEKILIIYGKSGPSPVIPQNKYLSFIVIEDDSAIVQMQEIGLDSCYITFGLPNMPNYHLGALQGSECDTLNTAIQESTIQKTFFTVYPNPATDYLYVENSTQEQLNLIIRDVKGSVCMQINHLNDTPIDINHLPVGMYSVIAIGMQSGKVFNDKFIKL